MTASPLSQRLRAARQAIHPEITQRQVASRLHLSPSAVNLWESGKTQPRAEHLAELARWYSVSTDWLLGVEVDRRAQQRSRPSIHSVPVVDPSALVKWHWDSVMELLQTAVAYPPGTAAGMLVSTDAIASDCPHGAYAVVSKAHECRVGQVVLASVGRASEPVLRRYIREATSELLIADDTRFPTYRLEDGVRILGRVVEVTVRKILA